MPIVNNYTALLGGNYWTGEGARNTPAIITYSFERKAQNYLESEGEFSSSIVSTFEKFSGNDRVLARQALEKWSSVSGLEFVEVAPGTGDMRFGELDFGVSGAILSGFAFFPTRQITNNDATDTLQLAGDVFINTQATNSLYLMMHEIGHAIGFKHSFEDPIKLAPHLDRTSETVMAYGPNVTELGRFDISAVQHVYGRNDSPNSPLLDWAWDADTATLTQTWDARNSTILATAQHDIVNAGAGNDRVAGFEGNDVLNGELGNDRLFGGSGDDVLRGGEGDDNLFGEDGNDMLFGGNGADKLTVTSGTNQLYGDEGNDELTAAGFSNWLYGGAGDDTLSGFLGYAHQLVGGLGNDTLRGDSSATLNYSGDEVGGISVDSNRNILASDGSLDTIVGIYSLIGSSSDDVIHSMTKVNAGDGNDTISGFGFSSTRFAGQPWFVHYLHYGEGGNDIMTGSDSIGGLMDGGEGNDSFTSFGFKDVMVGGDGNDSLSYAQSFAGVTIKLQSNEAKGGYAQGDRISGFENVEGSAFSDTLFGDQGKNIIIGNGGDDEINGHHGDDRLLGGDGNDIVRGRNDNDTVFGGAGDDRVMGDAGDDRIFGEDGNDTMMGGDGDDYMIGGAGDDVMYGGLGNDVLQARSGEDMVFGEEGDDILRGDSQADMLYGGDGDDYVSASGGNDTAEGGAGEDTVLGGGGSDVIIGGTDNDVLDGGLGNDTFVFATNDGSDRIRDWSLGNNEIDFANNTNFNSFADVQAAMTDLSNGNLRIKFDANNEVLLFNTLSSDLDASDFVF